MSASKMHESHRSAVTSLGACRVFCDKTSYHQEIAQYQDPLLAQCLPQLRFATDNADGAVRSARGFVFPPLLAIERGLPLAEWVAEERSAMQVTVMLEELSGLLAVLHAAGRVHRCADQSAADLHLAPP